MPNHAAGPEAQVQVPPSIYRPGCSFLTAVALGPC